VHTRKEERAGFRRPSPASVPGRMQRRNCWPGRAESRQRPNPPNTHEGIPTRRQRRSYACDAIVARAWLAKPRFPRHGRRRAGWHLKNVSSVTDSRRSQPACCWDGGPRMWLLGRAPLRFRCGAHGRRRRGLRGRPLTEPGAQRNLLRLCDSAPGVRPARERRGVEVHVDDDAELSLKSDGGPTCLTSPPLRASEHAGRPGSRPAGRQLTTSLPFMPACLCRPTGQ
jgi:hypothetical protein